MKKKLLYSSILLLSSTLHPFGLKNLREAASRAEHSASSAASSVGRAASSAASAIGNAASSAASSAAELMYTITVFNGSPNPIQISYFQYSNYKKIPRITQADWFNPKKLLVWDLKIELFEVTSQAVNGKANYVAHFPGDFYIRTDLTTEIK